MGDGVLASDPLQRPSVEPGGSAGGRRWTFGPAVLDERSFELLVNEQPVRLERKPLEVLLYLLRHAGEVVTKDELAENLWPGRILTETVLTRCISLLRQALKDDERTLIRTVHGYGYRLVAEIRVAASAVSSPPVFDFKVGDSPPLRPQWKLVERLGTGGHGEAWLARHEKTREVRVFKFALDECALSSLKREITLYRLLRDSLGARAAIVRILEWNLEEPPYFLEAEHVEGGNLWTWADTQGGLSGIPLQARLDLVAQIADALAAAHSVGVLHKDLKPSNVLVHSENGKASIKLCDFGSGCVLDPGRLEALGITRLGFTKSVAAGDTTSGTPLYLAPEVLSGQPFTVQADIYALGVLLYQMAVGDLHKALAPGWEWDVEDELLREDIALAAAGNPARRLADAAQLAERLRTLESRRQARAAEAAAKERAERARKTLQELRRLRVYALVLLLLAATAIAGGVTAYRARNDALAATVTAKAVNDFLMEDVLGVDPAVERPKDASYESLLTRAVVQVDSRFKGQPEAAANVHWLLGRRYQEIGRVEAAAGQYERAVDLFTGLYGRGAQPTLLVLDRLMWIYVDRGRRSEALAISEQLREQWASLHGAANLSTLMLRTRIARTLAFAGEFAKAESELRAVLKEIPVADPPTSETMALFKQWFGIAPSMDASLPEILSAYASALLATNVLGEFGDEYHEAESRLRESTAIFSRVLGESSEHTALARVALGGILALTGSYDEADRVLMQARAFFDAWLPSKHFYRGLPRLMLARLRLEQRRPAEAAALVQQSLDFCSADGCSLRTRAEYLCDLGRAYDQLGRWNDAIETFRTALPTYQKFRGPDHVGTLRIRVSLADALRKAGKLSEASATLSAISPQALAARPQHPVVADFRRVQGLLSLQHKEFERAVTALEESFKILKHRLGDKHWRTERARAELEQAQSR